LSLPTQAKVDEVEEIRKLMADSTVAIAADYTGLPVSAMTELRRTLRQNNVKFRVVKNRLARLAADAAEQPEAKIIIEGPTGLAFGFGDPVEPARALKQYVVANRSALQVRGGVLDGRALSADEVDELASLPPKDELVALLLNRVQSPIYGLANVLNAPIAGLARALQAVAESKAEE
jgi:large subunit ribosomal protein L10